jgi:transposase-like protein
VIWKSDIICPECSAGYRRIVITSCEGVKGEYRCLTCNHVLEVFDGSFAMLIRSRSRQKRCSNDPQAVETAQIIR